MRYALRFLPVLAVLASPALAETVAVAFAPPTDRVLAYHIEQHRPVAGKLSRFTADRELRFERAGDGYILHVTLRRVDSDAPGDGGEAYRAALTPLIGVEHRFHLDAKGKIVALDNSEAVSEAVIKELRQMLARFPAGSPRNRTAGNVLRLFEGLPPEGRLAMLAGEIQPLFLFAASGVEDGAGGRGLRTMAGSPLGRPVPVEGTLAVAAREGDRLTLNETLHGEGVDVTVRYGLSARSGLVERQERSLTVGPDTLTETRSLEPSQG